MDALNTAELQKMVKIVNLNDIYIYHHFFIYFYWRLIILQYCSGFCHTLT